MSPNFQLGKMNPHFGIGRHNGLYLAHSIICNGFDVDLLNSHVGLQNVHVDVQNGLMDLHNGYMNFAKWSYN
jgi:hypothetical protein